MVSACCQVGPCAMKTVATALMWKARQGCAKALVKHRLKRKMGSETFSVLPQLRQMVGFGSGMDLSGFYKAEES